MISPPPFDLTEAARLHMKRQQASTPDPLRDPRVMILELTEDQAKPFSGLGECFAIIGRGSYPGYVGKLCLYAVPVDIQTATAACGVAHGTHTAKRIRPATSKPRATITPPSTP